MRWRSELCSQLVDSLDSRKSLCVAGTPGSLGDSEWGRDLEDRVTQASIRIQAEQRARGSPFIPGSGQPGPCLPFLLCGPELCDRPGAECWPQTHLRDL